MRDLDTCNKADQKLLMKDTYLFAIW